MAEWERRLRRDENHANPIPFSTFNNSSGFTHDFCSGTATPDQLMGCIGITHAALDVAVDRRATVNTPTSEHDCGWVPHRLLSLVYRSDRAHIGPAIVGCVWPNAIREVMSRPTGEMRRRRRGSPSELPYAADRLVFRRRASDRRLRR